MKKLTLRQDAETEYIQIPVSFIDTFMPESTQEELKVYLYLKRALADPAILLSLHDMADLFDVTPKKIMNALSVWEERGVLSLSWSDGELSGITMLTGSPEEAKASAPRPESAPARAERRTEPAEKLPSNVMTLPDTNLPPHEDGRPTDLSELDQDQGFADLMALAEYLLKAPVSWRIRDALGTCYLLFDKNADIAEYLIEYCIEQGRATSPYLLSVARSWKKEGLTTLAEIREASARYSKTVNSIKNALGIKNRELVKSETEAIDRWTREFDMEMILEACKRTIEQAGRPSVKYVDSIIRAWEDAGVRTLEDAKRLDDAHRADTENARTAGKKAAKTSFHNFPQRTIDYNALVGDYLET